MRSVGAKGVVEKKSAKQMQVTKRTMHIYTKYIEVLYRPTSVLNV